MCIILKSGGILFQLYCFRRSVYRPWPVVTVEIIPIKVVTHVMHQRSANDWQFPKWARVITMHMEDTLQKHILECSWNKT